MKNKTTEKAEVSLREVKEIVKAVLPQPKGLINLVSDETHAEALASLKQSTGQDKFFFTFNFMNQTIGNVHRVSEHLGYNDNAFDFARYMSIIHPHQIAPLTILAKKVFDAVNMSDYPLSFGGNKYVILLVLRHADGRFVLTKRTLSCWQYVKTPFGQEMAVAYLNEYVVIDANYDETQMTGLNVDILNTGGTRLLAWKNRLREEAEIELEKEKFFTAKELNIIRQIANEPTLTKKELADIFFIAESSFDTHRKNILRKGRYLWGNMEMTTLKNLALMMRRDCMI